MLSSVSQCMGQIPRDPSGQWFDAEVLAKIELRQAIRMYVIVPHLTRRNNICTDFKGSCLGSIQHKMKNIL